MTKETIALPKGILKSDLSRPEYDPKDKIASGKNGSKYEWHTYQLYFTERFGWVVCTLQISPGKRGQPARYYARTLGRMPVDGLSYSEKKDREAGQQCRVGQGPHVKQEVTVYVKQSRLESLQWLIDEYNKGMESAGDTRDRISTKRARTASRKQSFPW